MISANMRFVDRFSLEFARVRSGAAEPFYFKGFEFKTGLQKVNL